MKERYFHPDGKEAACPDGTGHDLQIMPNLRDAVCSKCEALFWLVGGTLLRRHPEQEGYGDDGRA